MKILLLALDFYGYTKELIHELERRKHQVAFFEIRPFIYAGIRKYRLKTDPNYRRKALRKYADHIIQTTNDTAFDLVLMISINTFQAEDLSRILAPQKHAVKIYYMWDSLANFPFMRDHFALCDKVYSFDPKDCEEESLIYQPTWASGNVIKTAGHLPPLQNDITFIAVAHPDRYMISEQLKDHCRKEGISYAPYLYVPSPLVLLYLKLKNKVLRKAPFRAFHFHKLSDKAKTDRLARSKATFDLAYGRQTGLTQRAIEALVLGRKVITTNKEIRKMKIYDPKRILIIENDDLKTVTKEFLDEPVLPYAHDELKSFTVESFVEQVVQRNLPKQSLHERRQ